MSLAQAFAEIALAASDAIGGPFYDARIVTAALTQDEGGDSVAGAPSYRSCSVQVDLVTDAMRRDGFIQGDARFLILGATLAGTLNTDERVELLGGPHAGLWQVSALERDPVGIGWVGKGRRA